MWDFFFLSDAHHYSVFIYFIFLGYTSDKIVSCVKVFLENFLWNKWCLHNAGFMLVNLDRDNVL